MKGYPAVRHVSRWRVWSLVTVMLIGAASLASAAIPSSDSAEIVACYSTKSGELRVIDHEDGTRCSKGEVELRWNQVGPPGEKGEPGPAATLSPGSITGDKLADASNDAQEPLGITTRHIEDQAVTDSKLAGGIPLSKLATAVATLEALSDETVARTAADENLDVLIRAREAEILASLQQEASIRSAADVVLQQALDDFKGGLLDDAPRTGTGAGSPLVHFNRVTGIDADIVNRVAADLSCTTSCVQDAEIAEVAGSKVVGALSNATIDTVNLTGISRYLSGLGGVSRNMAAGEKAAFTLSTPGVRDGDFLSVSPPPELAPALLFGGATIAGADEVTVYLYNTAAGDTWLDAGATWSVHSIDLTP